MSIAGTNGAFERIRLMVVAESGFDFLMANRYRLERALARRMAAIEADGPGEYLRCLGDRRSGAVEMERLISEVAVGETYFFRHPEQFAFIQEMVLPRLAGQAAAGRTPRVWSAACSTGEEAYSLAVLLAEAGILERATLVATDVSPPALKAARRGRYGPWSLRHGAGQRLGPWLKRSGGRFRVDQRITAKVAFKRHDLTSGMPEWSAAGLQGMDLILCRNVLIYFDKATVAAIGRRLMGCLRPGGWLVTGPCDPLLDGPAIIERQATRGGTVYYHTGAAPSTADRDGPAPCAEALDDRLPPVSSGGADDTGAGEQDASEPADPRVRIRALADSGQLDEALRLCEAALAQAPLEAPLHYQKALLGLARGDVQAPLEALRRATYLDPCLVPAHLVRSYVHAERGERTWAMRALRQAQVVLRDSPPEAVLPCAEGLTAAELAATVADEIDRLESPTGEARHV